MIDHCIAAIKKANLEKAYRIYITDALQIIAENTANFNGGKVIKKRFADILPQKAKKEEAKEETRTAEDIVAQIKAAIAGKR